jgi:hypothetical protein
VNVLIFIFDRIAVPHEAATIATLDDDLVPVIEVSSVLEAQDAIEESHIGGPVDGRS